MTKSELMVEGEPVRLILKALRRLMENSRTQNGMTYCEAHLSGDSGAAFVHALGRITAELHAADVRSFLPGGTRTNRTEDQRRADAVLVLVQRVGEAMGIDAPLIPDSHPTSGPGSPLGSHR